MKVKEVQKALEVEMNMVMLDVEVAENGKTKKRWVTSL